MRRLRPAVIGRGGIEVTNRIEGGGVCNQKQLGEGSRRDAIYIYRCSLTQTQISLRDKFEFEFDSGNIVRRQKKGSLTGVRSL